MKIQVNDEVRDATEEELNSLITGQADALADEAAKQEAITKRATAEAKLAALGLTADDLKALGLGGN